jgi:hypothetical protein
VRRAAVQGADNGRLTQPIVVEEIKRWFAERRLGPGDKLPKEDEPSAAVMRPGMRLVGT